MLSELAFWREVSASFVGKAMLDWSDKLTLMSLCGGGDVSGRFFSYFLGSALIFVPFLEEIRLGLCR